MHIAKLKVTPHLFAFRGSHGPKATPSSPAGSGAVQTAKNANPFAASAAAATASGVAGGSKSDAAGVRNSGAAAAESGGGVGHGSFVVKVMLDAASPSSLDPSMGGGAFSLSDDDDSTEVCVCTLIKRESSHIV